MGWIPPQIDATHAMCQPDKRARAKRIPTASDPRSRGSHEQREQWMRERQQTKRALLFEETRPDIQDETLRMASIEGQREAQLLAEAESEIRRRRHAERID